MLLLSLNHKVLEENSYFSILGREGGYFFVLPV